MSPLFLPAHRETLSENSLQIFLQNSRQHSFMDEPVLLMVWNSFGLGCNRYDIKTWRINQVSFQSTQFFLCIHIKSHRFMPLAILSVFVEMMCCCCFSFYNISVDFSILIRKLYFLEYISLCHLLIL